MKKNISRYRSRKDGIANGASSYLIFGNGVEACATVCGRFFRETDSSKFKTACGYIPTIARNFSCFCEQICGWGRGSSTSLPRRLRTTARSASILVSLPYNTNICSISITVVISMEHMVYEGGDA